MIPAPRPVLDTVPLYVPKPPVARADGTSHRLFLNENPYPPLPSVLEEVSRAALVAHHYPEIMPGDLVAALAQRLGVPESDVVTGPGTVGIYQQIAQAMLDPGDEVVYAWPSFEAYPIVARIAAARAVEVPLRDGVHDLEAMAARVSPRTRAVFLCDPNNPTGTAVRQADVEAFLAAVPPSVLVVLDEAYREFSRGPGAVDGVELYRRHPNVLVLRTFSKAYGLAGLRVGYGVAHPVLSAALRKCAVPCGVNGIAVRAALASLRVEDELFARVDGIVRDRDALREALVGRGIAVLPSETNFLWLPLGQRAGHVAATLEAAGLMARLYPGEGIRLTVGTPEANARVVTALEDALVRA
ncbi:histidinol-phosphate transaminase [Saccharothrix syringae]|uniref:Histidinol-phosphate aminotransferase n=1 Tax=Saccharothrix syringae TaxID=103733 RepID=A0A5Q0H0C4_SACSY|nr:histidinol-phosphate transaminase [Saccharothrix syringae]QFZ19112.1 aminotransferase class I/II-fold pyridoxal phosphate-dependent enzyme [Saccharothrix syringae]